LLEIATPDVNGSSIKHVLMVTAVNQLMTAASMLTNMIRLASWRHFYSCESVRQRAYCRLIIILITDDSDEAVSHFDSCISCEIIRMVVKSVWRPTFRRNDLTAFYVQTFPEEK